MLPSIDLLVTADLIHTLGPEGAVEGIAIRDGRVVAAGSRSDLDTLAGANTRRLDLSGTHVVPGFIETHMHPLYAGIGVEGIQVSTPPHRSITSILAAISDGSARVAVDSPVRAWGFDDTGVNDNRHLTAADLDRAAPDHIVFIQHVSGHSASVNSRVLREAGITRDTPDPGGGSDRPRCRR